MSAVRSSIYDNGPTLDQHRVNVGPTLPGGLRNAVQLYIINHVNGEYLNWNLLICSDFLLVVFADDESPREMGELVGWLKCWTYSTNNATKQFNRIKYDLSYSLITLE